MSACPFCTHTRQKQHSSEVAERNCVMEWRTLVSLALKHAYDKFALKAFVRLRCTAQMLAQSTSHKLSSCDSPQVCSMSVKAVRLSALVLREYRS